MRLTAALAALISIAIIAIGCGDDEESNGSSGTAGAITTSSLSKDEYLQKANAACRAKNANYGKEINAHLKRAGAKGWSESRVVLVGIKTVVLPITEAQLAAVRDLGAPEGDEEEVEAALDAQQEAIAETRAAKQLRTVDESRSLFADATKMLERYGLKDCTYGL